MYTPLYTEFYIHDAIVHISLECSLKIKLMVCCQLIDMFIIHVFHAEFLVSRVILVMWFFVRMSWDVIIAPWQYLADLKAVMYLYLIMF